MSHLSSKPRVLFLTQRVPFPPDKGDRIRSWQLLKRLATRYDVWLGCLADEPWSEETESTLKSLCADIKIAPLTFLRWKNAFQSLLTGDPVTLGAFHSAALEQWIKTSCHDVHFDACVVFCSNMASYTRLPALRHIPLVVDLVDVDSEKWSDYAGRSRMPKTWIYRREARRLRAVERELGLRAAAVTLTTEAERTLYDRHAPEANSIVMGNGVLTDYFRRPDDTPPPAAEVVFVGAMDYRPNVEGIAWYVNHVWPEVRRQVPEAVLRIVGRRPTAAVRALADVPGVQIHADVPDVRPYLFGARASVVPLFVARGIQNKILEAMACETSVIASSAALNGLDVVPGEHALAAAEPTEWIEQTVRLLTNDDARIILARAGLRYVQQRCNWEEQIKPLMDILASLAPQKDHHASDHSTPNHNESIPVAVDYACR